MGFDFNADEIFEMAEQMERNGAKFYRKIAEVYASGQQHKILLELAAMEEQHEKTFAAMREELSELESTETVFDPDDQAALYLRAFADGYVFDIKLDPSKHLSGKETMEDIIWMAIEIEKDSIVFYTGIKEKVPERLGKSKVDSIIKEEMGHVTILSQQLKAIK